VSFRSFININHLAEYNSNLFFKKIINTGELKMKTTNEPKKKDTRSASHRASTIFAMIAIPVEFIIAIIIFKFVMGDPSNFIDNNPANNPLTGNYLGTVYKGGFIVPLLMTLLMMVITFAIERWWTLKKARGASSPFKFVNTVKGHITNVNLEAAKKTVRHAAGFNSQYNQGRH